MVDRLLRRSEVEEITGLSRSTIYRHLDQGIFPKPVRIGPRAVRWWLSEILNHIKSMPRGKDCGERKSKGSRK